jgi:anthranilate/para-aminobenzoate synthase component I
MDRLFRKLRDTSGDCALFESTTPSGPLAQRSLLAREPRAVLIADGRVTRIISAAGTRQMHGDPLEIVRGLLQELPSGRWPEEAAVVGAVAYDYARPRGAMETPRLLAMAVDRLEVVEDSGIGAAPERATAHRRSAIDLARHSNLSRDEYRQQVRRLQEHIAAGDIYQANLSQRFELPWPRTGLDLYERLRTISPTPFAGYLRIGDIEIVSASPERLLAVCDDRISTRPIAGTRPRSLDPAADEALAAELLLSEKERAEHLMLVDLERNDLGRVAAVGSVHVDELMSVEAYAHVRHIVSNVTARLAPGRDALDALRALFPGGTITGVPKRRCMEILDEIEGAPRGFYTGSLFYLTRSGRLDANILIRSAVVTPGRAVFNTGAGIVADSDPDREYEETLHKAEGMRLAMESAL